MCLLLLLPLVLSSEVRASEVRPPLRLAMSGAFQPFSTTDASGVLVGFDADIARAIAERMGREPALVQVEWAGIQASLQSGKVDLICGSMAITEERLGAMRFSLPYYVSGAQVFVRRGTTTLEGARLGVTEASTYERYIEEHPEDFAGVSVHRFGSEAVMVAALNADKIDAFVSDLIVGGFYAKRGGGDVVPFGELLYKEPCGIAARFDAGALVHEVNAALFSLIQDGSYARIYERWVGSPPDLAALFASWAELSEHIPPLDEGSAASSSSEASATTGEPAFAEDLGAMLPLLARGAWLTLVLSLLSALLALLTGVVVAIASVSTSTVLARLASGYVFVVRGTPLLVQLFLAYFGVATILNRALGFELMGAFGAALLALVVNTTAYNAESLRGGLLAVPRAQWEAALALGMTRGLALRRVVLPQALRTSLPSLGNNLVVLVKDTSLVGAITLVELTYAARNVVFQTGHALLPFLAAAVLYLALITAVSTGVRVLERRLSPWRRDP